MADRNILYRLRAALQGGKVAIAGEIENTGTETPNYASTQTDQQGVNTAFDTQLMSLQNGLESIANSAFNSGRAFTRFNATFTIDDTNLSTFNDRNILYTAAVDKVTNVFLPSDQDIADAGLIYPIVMEFTHLGGTARIPGNNVVRLTRAGGDPGLINDNVAVLEREEIAVVLKTGVGVDWSVTRSLFDPSSTILPSGVFELQTDQTILDIDDIETELVGVSIQAGVAYLVEIGGTRFNTDIGNLAVIVALVNSPSLATNSEDWLVIQNGSGSITNDSVLFLNQVSRDGTRFDFSRNVFADEANVIRFNAAASGTPNGQVYIASDDGSPTARSQTYTNQAIQFSDLVGGTLTLNVQFTTVTSAGFLPDPTSLVFTYGATNFTFPLTGVGVDSNVTIDIGIPNEDYSAILNTNCDVTLNYDFRGASYVGTVNIVSLTNTLDGTLRASITEIADNSASIARQQVEAQIADLAEDVDNDAAMLAAIQPRISPYKNVTVETPDINARFLDSTGSDSFPTDVATMTPVNPDNPRFEGATSALFIAVRAVGIHNLLNVTQSTEILLNNATANVELGESVTFNNEIYFVYRVTSLTDGEFYEVENVTIERVVAWPDDINNLQGDISRIDAELEHAALDLPDALIQVLDNEVTVTEEDDPTIVPTTYNNSLGDTGTQTVFYEPNANAPSGGTQTSRPFSELSGDQVRRKLLYIPPGVTYTNTAYVWAYDGTTVRNLIVYRDGTFYATVFVPAIPAGSRVVTVYPAQATQVSGPELWQNIAALTFVDGRPVAVANEVFFTRQLPSTATTMTIKYRGHANGNVFGSSSTTLANVGGSNEVATTFTLNDGSETVTAEVRWFPTNRQIRVSITERVNTGLPTINDIEVILSFDETRNVPETPATTREVAFEFESNRDQVFAFKPGDNGNLVIVGDLREVNTNYAFTVLFAAGETGHLTAAVEAATFLNYEDFDPISTTVQSLEDHATLPQFGLFTTEYTHETVVDLATQMTVRDNQGNTIPVGVAQSLTTTERNAMTTANTQLGTIVLDTTQNRFYGLRNGGWIPFHN